MHRVILVDDEPLALEGLRLVVDWQALGYEICGECGDGETAVALIEELAPDLVITDVRMPGLDGLGLIERVIGHIDCNIKFIVLSGYGEFEYAKKALQFGIHHYLLKPVFEEEMTEVLRDMSRQLAVLTRRSLVEIGPGKNSLLLNDVLCQMLDNGYAPEYQPLLQQSFSGAELLQPWSYLMVETGFGGERPAERGAIRGVIREAFDNPCFILEQEGERFGILIGKDALRQAELPEAAARLGRIIAAAGIDGFFIVVGRAAPDLYAIRDSYLTACQAWRYHFFSEAGRVILYDRVKDEAIQQTFDEMSYLDAVVDAFEELDRPKIASGIARAFAYFRTRRMAPEIVKMFVNNIVYRGTRLVLELNGVPDPLQAKGRIDRLNLDRTKATLADWERILQDYAAECCRYLQALHERNSQPNIYQIEEYIKQNFKHNLTIKEIAKNFYLHPAYLGQLFMKKFGFSFHEYLHRLRIAEAEKLVAATSLKSHEIAAEVGYNNYHSFLDNFKKYTGHTPADYKSRADG